MTHHYKHPRPALTADLVVLAVDPRDGESMVLLVQRDIPPFEGGWAIPGGHVEEGETLEVAARRELMEETGVETDVVEQVGTFGDPGRDPRGWVVSVVFATVVEMAKVHPVPGSDARRASWFQLADLPPLAFDHRQILDSVRLKLGELTDTATAPVPALAGSPVRGLEAAIA